MSDQLALIDELAAELGVGDDARRKWRERGRVAHRWRIPLMQQATRTGKEIDPEWFDRFSTEHATQ